MAEIGNYFDDDDLDQFFSLVEPGDYVAMIVDSQMRQSRSGLGSYLELQFEISDGPYAGRRLIHRLNLDHQSETVKRIARAELKAICRALKMDNAQDSEQLHNKPIVVKIIVTKRRDTGEDINAIRGFMSVQTPPPVTPPTASKTKPDRSREEAIIDHDDDDDLSNADGAHEDKPIRPIARTDKSKWNRRRHNEG